MRVIGGELKKQKIYIGKIATTRPMMDAVKEQLFNMLNNFFNFQNKIVLDLFAGYGQLGLEALSRGAKFCFFNDLNPKTNKFLVKNLKSINPKKYSITNRDFRVVLKHRIKSTKKIDLIFLDPPFAQKNFYSFVLKTLEKYHLQVKGCLIITEANHPLTFKQDHVKMITKRYTKKKYLYIASCF